MKFYIVVLFALFFLFPCLPAHYVYTPLVVSDIEKKGDYSVSGTFTTSPETKNFNLNGHYGIANHWILQASITNRDDYLKAYKYDTKGNSFDVAIGYTNVTPVKNFYIESFIGYGSGNLNNTGIENTVNYAKFGYNKIFSQFNFNYKLNSTVEDLNTLSFHFPIRIAYVHFNEISYNSTGGGFGTRQIETLIDDPREWKISIGKIISYRFKDVKLSLSASYHSTTNAVELFTFGNIFIGGGISWRNFFITKTNNQ